MYTPSPALDKYNAIQEQLQPQQDPISMGAEKGMQAAKTSLSLSPPRSRRPSAMGRGLVTLGSHIQPPQPGTGRAGMLQSIAQAMGPAAQAYQDAQEKDALYEMQRWKMEQEMIKQQREQELDERKMSEIERHNKSVEGIARGRYGEGFSSGIQLGAPLRKSQIPLYTKKKLEGEAALHNIEMQEKHLQQFLEKTANNKLNPLTPGGRIFNPIKKGLGELGAKESREEQQDLAALRGLGNQTNVELVKALKGGIPTKAMMEELKDSLPRIGYERPELSMKKMAFLKEKALEKRDLGRYAIKYGQMIDSDQLEELRALEAAEKGQELQEQTEMESAQPTKRMPSAAAFEEAKRRLSGS